MEELHKSECIISKAAEDTLLYLEKGKHLDLATWHDSHNDWCEGAPRIGNCAFCLSLLMIWGVGCPSLWCQVTEETKIPMKAMNLLDLFATLEKRIG